MGDIPDGWTATTLGEIGQYFNGRAFKTSEWSSTGRPIIRIQDLTGSNRNPHFFNGDAEERHVVRPGDFLISWSATLGAYIWDGPEAVLNQHIFKVKSKISQRFHYHLVRERITELERNAHGSGMVHVTKGVFDSTSVAVPELAVQERLVELIDSTEEKSASAQLHLLKSREAVERLRRSLLVAACTGRLTEDFRNNQDSVSVEHSLAGLTSQRKSRRRSNEQSVDIELPPLPESYIVATVGDAATLLEYGTSKQCIDSATVGVPVLRMGNIQDGALDLADLKFCRPDREIERLLLEDGDLLFNRTNSPELVGKSAVFHGSESMSFASYLLRVRFSPEVVLPDYVAYWLNSAWGRAWARLAKTDGVSQSNINGSKLALMPLPLPPVEEQVAIVDRVSRTLSATQLLLDRIDLVQDRVDDSSYVMLHKALTGGFEQ